MAWCLMVNHYLNQCWLIMRFCGIPLKPISEGMLKISILNISLIMFDSRLQAYLSGVNELTDISTQRTATWKSLLTHWGRDKMAAITQTTLSNDFFRMKMFEFRLREISPKFVPKAPINNIPLLVQMMAWRRPGDKPSSEPMMVSLLTHMCVTRLQWVNWYIRKEEPTWKSLSRDFGIFTLLFTLNGYVPKSPLLFVLLLQSILLFKYSLEAKTKLIERSLKNIWCE